MRQMFARRAILGHCVLMASVALLLAFASDSRAETIQFSADLKGSNQVPPSQTAGTGTVTARYESVSKKLSWNGSYSGLSAPPTAAHIHGPAAAGTNARLVFWISDNIEQCSQGECRSKSETKAPPLVSPFEGSATLTEAQAADLIAGRYYVNIHTDAYPRGEIRGQLVKSP